MKYNFRGWMLQSDTHQEQKEQLEKCIEREEEANASKISYEESK